jgi:hypothetical protein
VVYGVRQQERSLSVLAEALSDPWNPPGPMSVFGGQEWHALDAPFGNEQSHIDARGKGGWAAALWGIFNIGQDADLNASNDAFVTLYGYLNTEIAKSCSGQAPGNWWFTTKYKADYYYQGKKMPLLLGYLYYLLKSGNNPNKKPPP